MQEHGGIPNVGKCNGYFAQFFSLNIYAYLRKWQYKIFLATECLIGDGCYDAGSVIHGWKKRSAICCRFYD